MNDLEDLKRRAERQVREQGGTGTSSGYWASKVVSLIDKLNKDRDGCVKPSTQNPNQVNHEMS